MYLDLLKAQFDIKKENILENKKDITRFSGIYKPEETSSSSSDEEQTLGSKKLSNRKSQKLLNYLLEEINTSR